VYTFGTLTLDREYGDSDYKSLVPISRFGLTDDFYGGRVKYIGIVPDTDTMLCVEYRNGEHHVIDTCAQRLEKIPIKFIKDLCKKRKITFENMARKDELIQALERW